MRQPELLGLMNKSISVQIVIASVQGPAPSAERGREAIQELPGSLMDCFGPLGASQ